MNDNGLPVVDEAKCTGCGLCVKACPRSIIQPAPATAYLTVNCRSTDRGPEVQKYCKVGCIACGICVKAANNHGIRMEHNLAIVDYAVFSGDSAAADKCPKKTIVFQKEKFEKRTAPQA
jgi:NAD-dependent dihydropyrimidine dehydrogenase PreA subunit